MKNKKTTILIVAGAVFVSAAVHSFRSSKRSGGVPAPSLSLPRDPDIQRLVESDPVGEKALDNAPSPSKTAQGRDEDYYIRGYETLAKYVEREAVVERLNKGELSAEERTYLTKVVNRLSFFKLKAIDLKLTALEKELRVGQ